MDKRSWKYLGSAARAYVRPTEILRITIGICILKKGFIMNDWKKRLSSLTRVFEIKFFPDDEEREVSSEVTEKFILCLKTFRAHLEEYKWRLKCVLWIRKAVW